MNVKDNRGWIPLHEAAYHGHSECQDLLLKQGARLFQYVWVTQWLAFPTFDHEVLG